MSKSASQRGKTLTLSRITEGLKLTGQEDANIRVPKRTSACIARKRVAEVPAPSANAYDELDVDRSRPGTWCTTAWCFYQYRSSPMWFPVRRRANCYARGLGRKSILRAGQVFLRRLPSLCSVPPDCHWPAECSCRRAVSCCCCSNPIARLDSLVACCCRCIDRCKRQRTGPALPIPSMQR